MMTRYRQKLLSLIPKAIGVFEDALSSEDERMRIMAATKLMESLHVMPRAGSGQVASLADFVPPPLEGTGKRKFLKRMLAMTLEKSETHGTPLPPEMKAAKADAAKLSARSDSSDD